MFTDFFARFKKEKKKRTPARRTTWQTALFEANSFERWYKKRKKRLFYSYLHKCSHLFGDIKKSTFFVAWITCIMLIIAFIVLGPLFKVTTIYISREDNIIHINSAYNSVEYVRWKNIFLLDTSEIAERILKQQKSIQNIEFAVDFPNTLNINLKAYTPIFQTTDYLILSNWVPVRKEDNRVVTVPELLISKDISELELYGKAFNIKEIKNIWLLISELERNIPGFQVVKMKYYITEKELIVSTDNTNIFIFDLNGNIKNQVQKLAIFQKEQSDFTEKKYIYLDIRVPQRLFLCGYEEEYNCRNNLKKIYWDSVFTDLISESS